MKPSAGNNISYVTATVVLAALNPDLFFPTAAAQDIEEVVVVGYRNVLDQELYLHGDVRLIDPEDQVSTNRTIGDWMEHLPGVSLNGQGGLFQSYSIRGFSRWRVRTEVDGVPLITDRRAGNSGAFLPPDLVRRVRVMRGPGSSFYGSGAMGGTVSLSTLAAEGPGLTSTLQSNDSGFSATAWNAIGETFQGAFSLRRAGFAIDADGDRLNSRYEQAALSLKSHHSVDDLDVAVSWVPSYGRDIGKSSESYPLRQVTDYPQELHSIAKIQIEREGRWLTRVYHHHQDWNSRIVRVGQRTNVTDYEAHTLGGLFYLATDYLNGIGRFGAEWVGRRGVSIREAEYDTVGNLVLATQQVSGEEDNLALFVDQQWRTGRISLGAGMRYDYIEQSDRGRENGEDQLSASAGASAALGNRWRVSAEVGTGFRAPSLTERYFNGVTPRGDTLGNPDLEPEQTVGTQLRAAFSGNDWSASVVAYHNDVDGYIERFRLSDNQLSYRNVGRADIRGYELEMGWRSAAGWNHRLSYQWQRGENGYGEPLADLNPPAWRYWLAWQGQRSGMQSDLTYRNERSTFGAGERPMAATLIWNGRWTRGLGNGWQSEIYVNNILNQLYRATADEEAPYQPGRVVGLRLSWSRQ